MKKITIDWFCYEKEGKSCGRCHESYRTIEQAMERIGSTLQERGISIELRQHKLDEERIDQSNTVFVNGKDVMSMLKERDDIFSYCRSCTSLTGKPTECRAFIYRNKAYESIPEEMIIEAVLQEAGA
jgi:hypothetical protein